MKVLVLTM